MNQLIQGKIPTKKVEQIIKAKIKQELSAQGINTTTKQGNKELKFLINKISTYSFESQEQIENTGDKLASHLRELFQQKKKQNLDASLIRQVSRNKNIWSLVGLSLDTIDTANSLSSSEKSHPVAVVETKTTAEETTEAVKASEPETVEEVTEDAAESEPVDNVETTAEETTDADATSEPETVEEVTEDAAAKLS